MVDEPEPDSLLEVEEREDPLREVVSSPNLTVLREVSLGMMTGRRDCLIWVGRLLVPGLATWARRRCRNTQVIQHVFCVDLTTSTGENCRSAQSRRNGEDARRGEYLNRANWAVPELRLDKAVGNTPS